MKKVLSFIVLSSLLMSQSVVVPDNYKISKDKQLGYIYSKEYTDIVPALKDYQTDIMKQYGEEFGYSFDTTMYVGLASLNNQIANGFATPIPFNSQLFYGAGSSYTDYFCDTSWLKTLAIHETAHNFQFQAKDAEHRQFLYKWFGNSLFSIIGIPLTTLPNLVESSFIFEGNAVMNESRFANGGRLYSGYALANVVSLAHANKIKAELVYNPVLQFPYGEQFYLVGGFYQKYLVEKYGIKKVNGYFKALSSHFFTTFTNSIHEEYFGKSFEDLLAEFSEDLKQKHKNFVKTEGILISKSQAYTPMNSDSSEIISLQSNMRSASKIMRYNKNNTKVSYKNGNWRRGEVFKLNGEYYTQTTAYVNANKIEMGLYDDELNQKAHSGSKVLQGVLPNGKEVYFDVTTSIESPKIYVGGSFYDDSHSSVYVSESGDLYYFKQDGHTRTLYKNKKALYSYEGHYGFVTDIGLNESIYFIAKSKHGSTAYMYDGTKTQRVSKGDDVIDIKLISPNEALVATVGAHGYEYRRISLENKLENVSKTEYSLEDSSSDITLNTKVLKSETRLSNIQTYNAFKELEYSYTTQSVGYTKVDGVNYSASFSFADAFMQNQISVLLGYEEDRQIFGLSYSNYASLFEYGTSIFALHHTYNTKDDLIDKERDYGYSVYARYPLLKKGYWRADIDMSHTKMYDSFYREPTTLSFNLRNKKHFGYSKLPNSLNEFDAFISKDRESYNYGFSYTFMQDIGWQSRLGFDASYLKSDTSNEKLEKGIHVSDDYTAIQNETAQLIMPSLNDTIYVKEAKKVSVSIYKTFDTPLYFFTFPISLHRETLYAKQSYYDLDLGNEKKQYNESTLGLSTDLLIFNKVNIDLNIEMVFNKDVEDDKQLKVRVSQEF